MRITKQSMPSSQAIAFFIFLLLLLLLFFTPFFSLAQEAPRQGRERRVSARGEEISPGDIVRIDTDLVSVEVTVKDGAGQSVRGLRQDAFRIFEDEVEQPISFFSAHSTGVVVQCPLDLVFALDVSGSMKPHEMEMLRDAATHFKESLSEHNSRFAVVSFGMRVKVLQSFTDDPRKLDKAFNSAIQDEMGLSTHVFDAVDDAVRLLVRQGRKTSGEQLVKRIVIVISDGFPTGDTVSARTVIERANAANVSVYSVTMPSFSFNYASHGRPLPTILDISGLVAETGGVGVYATDQNYTDAFKSIREQVLSKYVIAFYPNKEKRDGQFHKLRIAAPGGLNVSQSRQGYEGKGQR